MAPCRSPRQNCCSSDNHR